MKLSPLVVFLVACGSTEVPDPEPVAAEDPVPEAPSVNPIPDGMHTLNPSLVVDDVPAAIAFYEAALGAKHRYTLDGPDGSPMHAEVQIGDTVVMIEPENADRHQASPKSLGGSNGSLMVYVEDVDAAMTAALGAGATERMAAADMWWGDRYAEVLDPMGHRWAFATQIETVSADAMNERATAAMAAMAAGEEYAWEKGEAAPSYKPEGSWTVTPYLVIAGGADSVDFYAKALGATVVTTTPTPDGNLMHAELKIGDSTLMLSSEMPAEGDMAEMAAYAKAPSNLSGSPVQLMIYVDDAKASMATAIAGGAKQVMEVRDTFWGDRYGVALDPSGTPWGIATHIEDLDPATIKERMAAQMGGAEGAPGADGDAPAAEGAEGEGAEGDGHE